MFQAKRRQRLDSKSLRSRASCHRPLARRVGVESLEPRMMLTATAGTWTALAHAAPTTTIGTMELLSNGNVLASAANLYTSNASFKLTPDASGSYVNGTWSQAASDTVVSDFDATNVLQDGRVFVLGGEYDASGANRVWNNTGEIYNPVTDTWTAITPFPEPTFGGPTELLPDGRVLAGSMNGPQTYIYDPAANTWSNGPTKLYNDSSWYETWTKLPDDSVLSYDLNDSSGAGSTQAQRYVPSTTPGGTGSWVDAGIVPVALQAGTRPRIGPAVLVPNGQVFQVGADSNTALYDPSTNTWTAGPVIPGGLGGNEAAAAMLPNGHVLFAASAPPPGFGGPTHIFEFDPNDSSLTDVTPSTVDLSNQPSWVTRMLVLPSGQALFTYGSGQLYVYTPVGSPQPAWQPTISSVAKNGDGTFTLTGTQLNGLSAGASFGFAAEMDSNYPLVELQATDGSGHAYFAQTFNWSSTGVATGSTSVSTSFSLLTVPYGTYSLSVVANGIASAPVSFTGGIVGPSADLAVSNVDPGPDVEGGIRYNLLVTNNGFSTATSVVLTDTLSANAAYTLAYAQQGTVKQSRGVITFSLGSIAPGQSVWAVVDATAAEDGALTNTASVTSKVSDPTLSNNSATVTSVVTEPARSVSAPISLSGKKQMNVMVATFTHALGVEPTNAFVATIAWGDGSTSTGTITQSGATYTVKGSHTYSTNGPYTVTTTVVESGESAQNSAVASVATVSVPTASATSIPSAGASAAANGRTSAATRARDAVLASLGGAGDLSGLFAGKADGGGAEMPPNPDELDLLFEKLVP